ncbi:hypothetical protein UPYG_G00107720 [Umbra pygmaea]|uniref:Poly [ADP-ribose] polymerase n=1 Tax=Umbra pygmaea TaxID=75934 RepID=A0ABD0XPT2_UMBPY
MSSSMADGYQFALLVEIEEKSDISKLKHKLVKYFQSKKANGGECEVDVSNGHGAVVRFRTEEVRQKVLEQQAHHINLEQGVLKLTVRHPSDVDISAQEISSAVNSGEQDNKELESSMVVLGNIQEDMDRMFLEKLVENIMKSQTLGAAAPTSLQSFTVEILPDIFMAVVTFQNGRDCHWFFSNCTNHRVIKQKQISIKVLEMTAKLKVENIPPNYTSDYLTLYYESEGDVVDVVICEEEQSAIITFEDPKAVHNITRKHHDEKDPIKVYPFYESLGRALYGKDEPKLMLPTAFSYNIDQAIWRYLHERQKATETIHKTMAEHFCKVNLQCDTIQLSPLPSLLAQKAKHVQQWKNTVKLAFTDTLSKFKSLELPVQDSAWDLYEEEICKLLSAEDVVVVPYKVKCVLIVAGLVDDVDRLRQSLDDMMVKISGRIEREKISKTEEVVLAPSIYHVLSQDGLQTRIAGKYPDMKMMYYPESQKLILNGLMQEVLGANRIIMDDVLGLKRKMVEVSNYIHSFLQKEDQEKLSDYLFTSQSINAALEIDRHGVQLLAVSDDVLDKAIHQIKECLVYECIDVEDHNVLNIPKWKDLTNSLEETHNIPSKAFLVQTSGIHPNVKVIVSGYTNIVHLVKKDLHDFLCQNAPVDEIIQIKSNTIVKFIEERRAWTKKVKGEVNVSFKDRAICLSGIRIYVTECLPAFQDLVSSAYFDTLTILKPGAKMFFMEKEHMYVDAVKSKTSCVVQLVDEMPLENLDKTIKLTDNLQQNTTLPTETQDYRQDLSTNGSESVQTKEGLTITLMKGNIQDALTDVVVNTVGKNLDLDSGAVSSAILHAAGTQLQQLINQHSAAAKVGEVIITKGCNLHSKLVFHAIAPSWNNGQGATEKILSGIIEKCLIQVDQQQLVSVTFPAIGTGNLGFPKDQVASLMLDTIFKFSRKKNPKHLKEVVFIIHPKDLPTFKAFSDEYNKRFKTQSTTSKGLLSASTQQGLFSKISSSSGMHVTKIGGLVIQVVTGDITKETTEVIVNSTNNTFNYNTGVSKAILDAAGQTVVAECQQHIGGTNLKDIIWTGPGNLKCKKILHINFQNNIQESVKGALQMCNRKDFTSISFPALGTGDGNVPVSQAADEMLNAIGEAVSNKSVNLLRLIRIVIFQPAMMTVFYNSMLNKEGTYVQENTDEQEADTNLEDQSIVSSIGAKFKSLIFGSKGDRPPKNESFVLVDKEIDPACFHICGDSQAKVNEAKQWVEDLVLKEQHSTSIKDDAIRSLSFSDNQRILEMQKSMRVRVQEDLQSPEASLTIMGVTKDVLQLTSEIEKMLRRVRDENDLKSRAEVASNVVEWQYQLQSGQYQSFNIIDNFRLEQANVRKDNYFKVSIEGEEYKISLPNGPATDIDGNSLNIRRIDKAALEGIPTHWDAMTDKTWESFPIQPGTPEHNDILGLFKATCTNNVLKIERIQNISLWKAYLIKKKDIEVKNGHQNNEKRLFHGTSSDIIDNINTNGFNRSFAGKNAAVYGNGTYFAVNASYSADDTYSIPDTQGHKHMYLCYVLTGDFTEGKKEMIVPPAKSNSSSQLYDSLTDNQTKPNMFIIFHDIQAYPAYLITFS